MRLCSLFVASYDSQGLRWRYSNPPPHGDSILGPLLYQLYTAGLPTLPESTTETFADDTAVVTIDGDPTIALQKLQTDLLAIQNWFKKMENNRIKLGRNEKLYSIHPHV
jgi:hypothetical protein